MKLICCFIIIHFQKLVIEIVFARFICDHKRFSSTKCILLEYEVDSTHSITKCSTSFSQKVR